MREEGIQRIRYEPAQDREKGSGSRRCVEHALDDCGVSLADLKIVMEFNSNEAMLAAVQRGVGVGFFCQRTLQDKTVAAKITPVKLRGFRAVRRLYFVFDGQKVSSPAVLRFLDFCKAGL